MREVTINGKTVVLETGITPAPVSGPFGGGRPKSDFRLLMEAMQPGESVWLPLTTEQMESKNLWLVGKQVGLKLSQRREGEGYRIFCTGKREAAVQGKSKANGAQPIRSIVRQVAAWA